MIDYNLISILSIGVMLIGALYSLTSPRGSQQYRRAFAVFALGAAVLVSIWLLIDEVNLIETRNRLALALISVIIFFINSLKRSN